METVQNFIATSILLKSLAILGSMLVYGARKPYNMTDRNFLVLFKKISFSIIKTPGGRLPENMQYY